VVSDDQEQVQHQIERAKIFREAYPSSLKSTSIARFSFMKEIFRSSRSPPREGYEKVMFSDGMSYS